MFVFMALSTLYRKRQTTVWLLIFEGDLFSLFSRVLHDLRKLKKIRTLTLRMLTQQWRSLVASHGSCSVVRMKAISECRASFREARRDYNPSTSNDSAAKKIQTHQQFIILPRVSLPSSLHTFVDVW